MNSFFVDSSPLLHGACVVRHIEISAEQVPFLIHLGDISLELRLLLGFDLSQFLESCLLFFLNFSKFNFILFLLFFFLVELFLQLNLHTRDIKIGSGESLSYLMLRIFMNNFEFLGLLGSFLSQDLFTSWMWLVLLFNIVELLLGKSGLHILAILSFVNESKDICIPFFNIQANHFDAYFMLMFLSLLFQVGLFKRTE